jgi:hypothetical protein
MDYSPVSCELNFIGGKSAGYFHKESVVFYHVPATELEVFIFMKFSVRAAA